MAFYLALSLVPFVGISIALVSRWFPSDLGAHLEDVLSGVLPIGLHVDAGEVLSWARSSASRQWLKGGCLLALWTSFRFMSLCIRAIGTTITAQAGPSGQSWRSAADSLLLLAVWTAALLATPLFLLAAPVIASGLLRLAALSQLSLAVLAALRTALPAGILFGAIFLTYRVAGGRQAGVPRVALAALLAALGWMGASLGFSRAVALVWGATQLYGALGSMVLFLIWAYLNSWILLLGAYLLAPRPVRP
jgi:membrane protein